MLTPQKTPRPEPNGGNLYRPHNPGGPQAPWRCAHGRTGFYDSPGGRFRDCQRCRAEDMRAFAEFHGLGRPHPLEHMLPDYNFTLTINHFTFPSPFCASADDWLGDPRFPHRAQACPAYEAAAIRKTSQAWEAVWYQADGKGQVRLLCVIASGLAALLVAARAAGAPS